MTSIVIIFLICFTIMNLTVSRIPKTGRYADACGEVIEARITNTNKVAERAAVLRAEKDGRKFKVKLKPTEAHLWIKGDSINITLSEDEKKYRVMFNDYFRQNESRLREVALGKLEKINTNLFAARFTEYKKEHFEMIKNSGMDSQRIFALFTYMKTIDIYTPVAALMAAFTIIWKKAYNPGWEPILVAVILIALVLWVLYISVKTCKTIIKKLQAQN